MDRRMMMYKTGLLPDGYTKYDYLYSTSESDYVNTGLKYSPSWSTLNLEFEAENNNSSSNSDAVIGANNATSSDTSNMLWYARQSKGGFSAYNLGVAKQLNTIPGDTRAVIKYFFVDGGESYMQWNDTTVAVATVSASSITANGKSLILCGGRTLSGSNPIYGMRKSKLGYVKFTDPTTGDLEYNFIPAYGETEGKYGFYETVHGVFYPETSTHMLGGYWE